MEPGSFGKKLGIGVRVASRLAKQRAAEASRRAEQITRESAANARQKAPVYAAKGRAVGTGTKRFGQAFFAPLRHVTRVLLLEITGVFFALFGLFFAQSLYRIRDQYATGPQHHNFLLYTAGAVVFLYFSLSSFVRARGIEKRQRQSNSPAKGVS